VTIRGRTAWGLVVAGVLASACRDDRPAAIEASGTIEATEADLGFQVAGRIDSILVEEGGTVRPGQRLGVLDQRELLARREAAVASLAAQQARLRELERGFRKEEIAQGRASLRAAERRLSDAERDRQRARNLFQGGAVSRQALDAQEGAYDVALAERDRIQEQVRLLERGARPEQVAAQRALVAQAEATLAQADALLAQSVIVAPFGGFWR